ncbi:MAG: NADP-specific glutamate dehydrogenase [Intestinibaculum porci]|uniref:Glutamate dehydrogenase n=1 Tax=Intestinibaculum porci TaxID=2487118 RepID=A0A3G9J3D7_9FIRM|nr:NADP-specific glutamate dehydrogenase [Intestinibaculum porci]MDD6422770.1 NADP-specific glutamate dehydrogenase [Intestinibaculum porci]BBH25660.1 glutamate dehydrogenase [Intestinibaculum porci]
MDYTQRVIEDLRKKYPDQPEFLETITNVLTSLEPMIKAHPEWEDKAVLERLTEPERTLQFKVPWTDDNGKVHVNIGYRVQFNSAIGPYKGGLRFHPSVKLGTIKFLGFEQIFKNSLTTLPIGGGKGGSDFDPQGKSDAEVMRFCQSFMTELYRHIGPNVDVPAGDIGVGGREIGYLFGQYKRIKDAYENGVLTGKGLAFGGSLIRPEATGYGAVYYAKEVLKHFNETLEGKTIVMSGYGNVAWGIAKKATEYGAKVVTISGRDGYVYDKDGINTEEKFNFLLDIRTKNDVKLKDYAEKFGAEFHAHEKPWGKVKADLAFPAATQNEIDENDAKALVESGVKYVFEGANMPTTPEGIAYFKAHNVILGPAKAANAGGVAVSALEMSQNSQRYSWSAEEVDEKLHNIMISIVNNSVAAAEKYGLGYDLVAGANLAGAEKVIEAMLAQGDY